MALAVLVAAAACGGGGDDDGDGGGGDAGGGDGALVAPEAIFRGDYNEVYRLVDRNGDGDFHDADEAVRFGDPTQVTDLSVFAPRLRAVDASTVLAAYSITEGSGSPTGTVVLQFEDQDGDGDALDAGEGRVWFSGALPGGGYASQLNDATWTAGAVLYLSEAYGIDDPGGVYRLEDVDGDGDADDPGEVTTVAEFPGSAVLDLAVADGIVWYEDCGDRALYRIEDGAAVWQMGEDLVPVERPFSIIGCAEIEARADGVVLVPALSRPEPTTIDTALVAVLDVDRDGAIDPAGESGLVFDTGELQLALSLEHTQALADGSVLVLDQYHEEIVLLQDATGDGAYREGWEVALLYDFATAIDNGHPPLDLAFSGHAPGR